MLEVGSEVLVVEELEPEEVVEPLVELLDGSDVEGGRELVVVGREVGGRAGLDAAEGGRRGPAVVEETPAKRLFGGLVVVSLATEGGDRVAASGEEGAVTIPSRLPPHAPTATATASVAHRRSRLNRTNAPACSSPLDDKRIGRLRPGFRPDRDLSGSCRLLAARPVLRARCTSSAAGEIIVGATSATSGTRGRERR